MDNPGVVLRYAILNNAKIYEQSNGKKPKLLVLSSLLLKVLTTRQLHRSLQRDPQEFLILTIGDYVLEVRLADPDLGDHFNFIGRHDELEDYTTDYIILRGNAQPIK